MPILREQGLHSNPKRKDDFCVYVECGGDEVDENLIFLMKLII